jgi:hypothetical protein
MLRNPAKKSVKLLRQLPISPALTNQLMPEEVQAAVSVFLFFVPFRISKWATQRSREIISVS